MPFSRMNSVTHKSGGAQLRVGQQIFGAVHRHVGHVGRVQQGAPLRGGAGAQDAGDFGIHGIDVGRARAVLDKAWITP